MFEVSKAGKEKSLIALPRHGGWILAVWLLVTSLSGCKPEPEPPQTAGPVLETISPQAGTVGTIVTLTGRDFEPALDGNIVVLTAPAQGSVDIKPIAASADQIRFIMPAPYAEQVQIKVRTRDITSTSLAFDIQALVDPTPGLPGNEIDGFHAELDSALAGVASAMEKSIVPALEANGQHAQVVQLHEALAGVREGFDQVVADAKATATPERLGAMDALMASPAFASALQRLHAVSSKLADAPPVAKAAMASGDAPAVANTHRNRGVPTLFDSMKIWLGLSAQDFEFSGSGLTAAALEDISDARALLEDVRAAMKELNRALIAAEALAGAAQIAFPASGAASIIPVLEEIRMTIVVNIIDVLNIVIPILDSAPTDAVGRTLAVSVSSNDLYMNQGFGSMRFPIDPSLDPGHMLVLEPYGVTGTVDFQGHDPESLDELIEDLENRINPVVAALLKLTGFEIERIRVTDVAVKLLLSTNRRDLFEGEWRGGHLRIAALAPGEGMVSVGADLEQIVPVGTPCPPDFLGRPTDCLHPADLQIDRRMRAFAGTQTTGPFTQGASLISAQVAGLPPNQGYIGDSLHITGQGFSLNAQLAPQDVYFGAQLEGYPPGTTGVAGSPSQRHEGYVDFDVEVPDALSGPLNVSLALHPSNTLEFTILPPLLNAPHPSAIVGEAWGVTGRGFSHALSRNLGDWNGGGVAPYAPVKAPLALSNEAAHSQLEFIVPDSGQSGPFKIITLGTLHSNSHEVAVRQFSEPVTLSAPNRAGLRPAVARDASNGNHIVAWIDHNNVGGNQLVATVLAAGTAAFTTPAVITAEIGGLPGAPPRPAVAAAGGNFYVAWVSGASGNEEVMFATSLDGRNWSAPVNLSSSAASSLQPTLAADGTLVVAAWIEEGAMGEDGTLKFRVSGNSGGSFNGAFTWSAGDVADPAVTVSGQTVAVAWSAETGFKRDVYVSRSNNGGVEFAAWRATTNSNGGVARHPSVSIGPACIEPTVNSLYIAWENSGNPDLDEEIYFTRLDEASFTTPLKVSDTPVHSRSPMMTVDADCTPALAWIEQGLPHNTLLSNGAAGIDEPLQSALRFARSFNGGVSFKTPYMQMLDKVDGSRLGHLAMIGTEHALLTLVYQDDVNGRPQIVLRTTEGEPAAPSAQPSNSGEANADLIYSGFNGAIYVSRANGTRLQRVLRDRGTTETVALSPGGRYMAFASGADRLMVAEADGAYPMQVAVTADFVMNGGLYWSPRGDYIGIVCFWSSCPVFGPLLGWVTPDAQDLNLVGHGNAPPSVAGFSGMQPWSPSGTLIYSQDNFGRVDPAVRMGQSIAVALPPGKRGYYPAWSPDGARIAFIASDDANVNPAQGRYGYGNLYVMNADGSNLVELTNSDDAATPVWSPDGARIAYVSNRNSSNNRRIFMLAASGELDSHVDLASNPLLFDDTMPAFLPDSSAVLIQRRNTVDNTTQLIVVDPRTPTLHSAYAPSGYSGPAAAFHLGSRPAWAAGARASTQAIGTTTVTLTWPDASDDVGIAYYRIYDGDTLLAAVPGANNTSFTLSNLTPGTSYTLHVRACDAAGNCSLSGPQATFTTAGAGPVPTWSVAPPTLRRDSPYQEAYQVMLGWTGANEPGVEYRIYRDGALARTALFPFAFVSGLRPQTTYTFRVEACFAGGNCTTDGPTLVYLTAADTSPLNLQTANVLGEAVTLHFNDPLDDTSVPAASDFTVTLNGAAVLVSGVVVHSDANELVLTLAEPAYAGDVVLLSHVPGAAPIRDFGGNTAGALSDRVVSNGSYVQGNGIASDADNSVYVVGHFEGAVRFGAHALTSDGRGDAYLAKRDAAGMWQWARRLGSAGWDAAYAVAVDAGHVYVAGAFDGEVAVGAQTLTANGATDLFVAKLDTNGNWVWASRAGGAPPIDPGTGIPGDGFNGLPFVEVANGVAVDSVGNVYIAGTFTGAATFGNSGLSLTSRGATDIVVAKLNAAGAWQWAARAGSETGDSAYGIAVDVTGVYAVGTNSANADFGGDTLLNDAPFVAKLDANAAWQWVREGTGVSGVAYSVATDGSGSVYVAGASGFPLTRPFAGRWNAAGVRQWVQTLAGSGRGIGYGLVLNNGSLYMAGQAYSVVVGGTTVAANGAFVAKIDINGGEQWGLGGTAWDGRAITSCGVDVVCAFGNYTGTAAFGALPPLTSGSVNDIYIVRARDSWSAGEWLSIGDTDDGL